MQQDELIWQVIYHGHCSFKAKVAEETTFCRNPYNVTGLCNRVSCPLANSRYATVREEKGKLLLPPRALLPCLSVTCAPLFSPLFSALRLFLFPRLMKEHLHV